MSVPNDLSYRLRLARARALRRSADLTAPTLERIKRLFSSPLEHAEAFVSKARILAGTEEFFGSSTEEALAVLLDSIALHNKLNTIGRTGLRSDILRLLTNNLLLTRMCREHPNIPARPLTAPVFIMGLPRTASTFLHSLLALDSRHRAATITEVTYPFFALGSTVPGHVRMRRALHWLDVLEPDFQNAYPAAPNSPQECSEILSNTLESLRFDSTYDVPEYLEWMDAHSHVTAYEFHKRFLQSMTGSVPVARWVLKCPDHVFYYEDLLAVYPDARIIVTHRDPARVLPSVASLTMILQGLFSDRVDPERVAGRVLDRWVTGGQRVLDLSRQADRDRLPVMHVFYDELVHDTLPTLERIYRFLGSPLTDEVKGKIRNHLGQPSAGSYRSNRYTRLFQDLLPASKVRERFHDYLRHFGLAEHGRAPTADAGSRIPA